MQCGQINQQALAARHVEINYGLNALLTQGQVHKEMYPSVVVIFVKPA